MNAAAPPARIGAVLSAWGPVVLWIGIITWLSSERFSDDHTASWLTQVPFLAALGLSPATIETLNLIVRKTAHFVEYATLSLLVYRAVGLGDPASRRMQRLWMAMVLAIACASLDELHQTLTLTRTGSLKDLLLNSLGAFSGALAGDLIVVRRRLRRRGA